MGSHTSHNVGKVILQDGSVHVFNQQLTVAELMLEHPQQVVVELSYKEPSKSNIKLNRPTPLAADHKLELDKVYLMLPLRRGKLPSFSSQDAHRILLAAKAFLKAQSTLTSSSRLLSLVANICDVNGSRGQSRIAAEKEGEDDDEGFRVGDECLTQQHVLGKGWKPSLDTIEEKREGRKEMNLVLLVGKVGRRVESRGLVWG